MTGISKEDLREAQLETLKLACNEIAYRHFCPLYLVGSFTHPDNNALDIDIVMVMPESKIERIFGTLDFNDRRLRFRKKQKDSLEDHLRTHDIDFKIQSYKRFCRFDGKRIKLDNVVGLDFELLEERL